MTNNQSAIKSVLTSFFRTIAVVFGFNTAIFVTFVVLVILGSFSQDTTKNLHDYSLVFGNEDAPRQFVAVPVSGLILGDKVGDDFWSSMSAGSVTYGYEVKQQLFDLAGDDEVDGILLEIHSPGGTIFGAQAIFDGIEYYRNQTGKPVYAFVGSMAASGGYWAAISADKIIADSGTSIGSIGVISGPFKYYDEVISENSGLLGGGIETRRGIETEFITAGKFKDIGNPYRQMSEQERAVLQESVDSAYAIFVDLVSQRRGLSSETIRESVGAMLYDEVKAEQLHLIDDRANWHEAVQQLASAANVESGQYKVLRPKRSGSWVDTLLGSKWMKSADSKSSQCPWSVGALAYFGDVAMICNQAGANKIGL